MPVESATYISQLSANDPPGSDKKHQGDDHLRLIKQVLKNSFPNSDKPLHAPRWEFPATSFTVAANDNNVVFFVNTLGGDVNVTLPAGVQSNFRVRIVKGFGDLNVIRVSQPGALIHTENGELSMTKIGVGLDAVDFFWTGAQYYRVRYGDPIGAVALFPAIAVPAGYIRCDGQVLSGTDNPELNVVYGGLFGSPGPGLFAMPNLMDRFPVGAGLSYAPREMGGANTVTLATAHLPAHSHPHSFGINDPGHSHGLNNASGVAVFTPGASQFGPPGLQVNPLTLSVQAAGTGISLGGGIGNTGSDIGHENRPPYFAMNFATKLC